MPDDLPTPERTQELEDMLKPKAESRVTRVPSNRKTNEGAPKGGLSGGLAFSNASQAPDHSVQKPSAKKVAVAPTSKRKRDDEANEDRVNNTGNVDKTPSDTQPPKKKGRPAAEIALEKEQKAAAKTTCEAAKVSKIAQHDTEIAAQKV